MTAKERRHENLKYLVDHADSREEFAFKLGYDSAGYITQLYSGHSSMGNNTARKIERGLGLYEGWMDDPHPEVLGRLSQNNDVYEAIEILTSLKGEDRKLALDIVQLFQKKTESNS